MKLHTCGEGMKLHTCGEGMTTTVEKLTARVGADRRDALDGLQHPPLHVQQAQQL
jgi:hypothetical protein